jgi:cytokinesis protein
MLLGANLNILLSARKDLPITPSTKMKQLQWDKLPHQQVSKTLWNEEEQSKEDEMIKVLQSDGVWTEMEEGFKAHQLVVNLMGMDSTQFSALRLIQSTARQKRAELKSVLDPQTKKRVGMYIMVSSF